MDRRRLIVTTAWALSVIVAAGVGAAATHATLSTPVAEAPAPVETSVEVVSGSVGRTVDLSGRASWALTDLARAAADGTVTSLAVDPGGLVDVGTVLLTVDLRPVVVARGVVPSFRDLAEGDTGADVDQLQQMLRDLTLLEGGAPGVFDGTTRRAVEAWQRSLALEPTGTVGAGDIAYLPEVPARVVVADGVTPGGTVSTGDVLVRGVASSPAVRAVVTSAQLAVVPTEGTVSVTVDDIVWTGVVSETRVEESGDVSLLVTAPDGSPVCGQDCDSIPVHATGEESVVTATMVVVPETSGPVVPQAAISTLAGGQTVVTTPDGRRLSVEILASADGQVVVSGVEPGERVTLSGTDE